MNESAGVDFHCDFHVHTSRSWDSGAEMTVPAIHERALSLGIRCVGLSDHLWLDRNGRWRPSPSRILGLRSVAHRMPTFPQLLVGAEIDCRAEAESALLAQAGEFDFIIVADHMTDFRAKDTAPLLDPERAALRLAEGFEAAARHPLCRIVGHPLYFPAPLLVRLAESRPGYAERLYSAVAGRAGEMAAAARSRGAVVELNARALNSRLQSLLLPVFKTLSEAGCRFAMGSDAHSLVEIGSTLKTADYARKIGIRSGGLLTADELAR